MNMMLRAVTYVRERRRHARIVQPHLALTIDGRLYKTRDWSLSGFALAEFASEVAPLDRISGRVAAPGGQTVGSFEAEVVRVEEDGGFGARFLEISPAVLIALGGFRPY